MERVVLLKAVIKGWTCEWNFWVLQPFRERQVLPNRVYAINRQRIGGQNWSQMAGFKKIWRHNNLIATHSSSPSDQAAEWSRSNLLSHSAEGGACCAISEFFCCVFLLNTVCWLPCQFWVTIFMCRIHVWSCGWHSWPWWTQTWVCCVLPNTAQNPAWEWILQGKVSLSTAGCLELDQL